MFGILRTILAIGVVFHHLGPVGLKTGPISVLLFFSLSGMLMTALMDGKYRDRPIAYLVNRALRLYPTYWVIFALTIVWMSFLPEKSLLPHPFMGIPSISDAIPQLSYLIVWNHTPNVVPTSWSVANELIWYALIGLGISRTFQTSLIWLFLSVLAIMIVTPVANRTDLYFSTLAAGVPYAFGSCLYHFSRVPNVRYYFGQSRSLKFRLIGSVTLFFIGVLFSALAPVQYFPYRYVAVVFGAPLFLTLFPLTQSKFKRFDDWIGGLSYPTYLCHFLIAGLLINIIGPMPRSYELAAIVTVGSLILSCILYYAVDRPIEILRGQVRKGNHYEYRPGAVAAQAMLSGRGDAPTPEVAAAR